MQWGIVPDVMNRNLWSLATSMFLHGGWVHLGGNMVFLWAFGRNIEDRIGSKQFAVFYILCGLAAAVIQVVVNPYSRVPTIGASGAIAGVMGAYLIKFSKTDIDTLFWMIFIWRMPIPAAYFLVYWFVLQFLSGLTSIGEVDYTGGGVAWFAHIGGFLAGMALIGLLRKSGQPSAHGTKKTKFRVGQTFFALPDVFQYGATKSDLPGSRRSRPDRESAAGRRGGV